MKFVKKGYLYADCRSFIGHQYYFAESIIGHNVQRVQETEFLALVSLSRYDPNENYDSNSLCTGALISPKHILTCEHCIEALENSRLVATIGSRDITVGADYYPIWWISYDQWYHRIENVNDQPLRFRDNDIALLKLFGLIPEVTPAVLSTMTPLSILHGLDVIMYGAGASNTGAVSPIMEKASVRVLTNDECEKIIFRLRGDYICVEENIVCTKNELYTLVGHGDSGGPVTFFGAIVAINAGVAPPLDDFDPERVNIHIGVEFYRNFIYHILFNT